MEFDRHGASPGSEPVPTELPGEPHRALVDTVLALRPPRGAWLAGGGPDPALPRYWSTLWSAAVRRQQDLAGQETEAEANSAVQSMVNHLSSLQQEASWFRDDDSLREGAIAETLLWTTGLAPSVPSRPAHEAWQRHQDRRSPAGEAAAAAESDWIEQWRRWALNR
jgi:hypothetical protein